MGVDSLLGYPVLVLETRRKKVPPPCMGFSLLLHSHPQDLWRKTMETACSTVASSAILSPLPTELCLHSHPNHQPDYDFVRLHALFGQQSFTHRMHKPAGSWPEVTAVWLINEVSQILKLLLG